MVKSLRFVGMLGQQRSTWNIVLKKISVKTDTLQSATGCTGFSGELVGGEVNLNRTNLEW